MSPTSGQQDKPRFDFGNNIDLEGSQTATIEELLDEINFERGEPAAKKVRVRGTIDGKKLLSGNLKTTFRLVGAISGLALRSTKEKHALTTLKTIKLLYKCSQVSDAHFIRIIEPPGQKSLVNIDFFTSPPTEETKDIDRRIKFILSQLEKEIDHEEIIEINTVCNFGALQTRYRHEINNAIDTILLKHLHHKDKLMCAADKYLAKETKHFLKSVTPVEQETRIHVATYIHLKMLEFKHRIYFDLKTELSIPNDRVDANKIVKFDNICQKLSKLHDKDILPYTNYLAIEDVREFCKKYAAEIAELVSSATGLKYIKRDIASDRSRAEIILYLSLNRIWPSEKANKAHLGVIHIVAAFCSILHQRKVRTKLTKESKKYGSRPIAKPDGSNKIKAPKISSPQKLFDAYIRGAAKGIPFTAQHIYVERMTWYATVLSGKKDSYDSHLKFIIAQTDLIQSICASNNHNTIAQSLCFYEELMKRKATEFLTFKKMRHIKFDWANLN